MKFSVWTPDGNKIAEFETGSYSLQSFRRRAGGEFCTIKTQGGKSYDAVKVATGFNVDVLNMQLYILPGFRIAEMY